MSLAVSSRLGPYEITALIGEGGMGRVYRATDTKLNRRVALKILPRSLRPDSDRLARFQQRHRFLLASTTRLRADRLDRERPKAHVR